MVCIVAYLTENTTQKGSDIMSRPQEQITESSYEEAPDYWYDYARQSGGIEVCDDETGEPIFVLGQ